MPEKQLHHVPYDTFFQQAMYHKRTAMEFFESYLPADILEKIDLDSLVKEKESIIDNDLGKGAVDVLFSVSLKNGQQGYCYILAEQQTEQEKFMAFRIFKYVFRIIEYHLSQHPKSKELPFVIPMLLHTGKCDYSVPVNFFDLFANPGFAKRILIEDWPLIELHKIPDEKLKAKVWSGLMQLMMKNIDLDDILPFLVEILDILVIVGLENFVYFKSTFLYAIERGNTKDPRKLVEFLREASIDKKEEIMTIAEQLRAEGRLEGIDRGRVEGIDIGRVEGIEKTARALLSKGMDFDFISEVTGLSVEEIEKLKLKVSDKVKH